MLSEGEGESPAKRAKRSRKDVLSARRRKSIYEILKFSALKRNSANKLIEVKCFRVEPQSAITLS